jgi:acyl-lipid omega-6 desaturase (Delta-12 desaturase)
MNRTRYLEIRNSVDLRHEPKYLFSFWAQTLTLMAACLFILVKFGDSLWMLLAVPLIAALMFRSFSFMHEAVHGLPTKNRHVNHVLGIISGTLCLLAFDSWKTAHLEHHRWGGNIDKDPVAAMIKAFPNFPAPLRAVLSFGWNCWLPSLAVLQLLLFWVITFRRTFKKDHGLAQILSAAIPVIFWLGVLAFSPLRVTVLVLLPSMLFYQVGVEVINAPHHLGLTYVRGETQVPVWEQYKIARSCVYPTWLARFIVLNFNYHTEHHMYPNVPWYHLDKLRHPLRAELGGEYNIDPGFAWILRNRPKDLCEVYASPKAADRNPAQAA